MFDPDSVRRESVLDRGNRLIANYNQIFSRNKVHIIQPDLSESFWKGPDRGWVKVNVDLSVSITDNRATIEGLIRDDRGGWVLGFYRVVCHCSILLAELWALHQGLCRAWDKDFWRVEVDQDSNEATCIVNRASVALVGSALVQAIWTLMQLEWLVRVLYVPREMNEAVDRLAAMGLCQSKEWRDFLVSPGPVAAVVSEEQQRWLKS
ncbi:hypothetical protein V6N11_013761 [Hibiscus sabdariffa]|uniref:Uncharacterized protein n=2 Tax=Hibiscus sabdariffa TaxID=183260 RepID=A0ABR2PD83_9ROSI